MTSFRRSASLLAVLLLAGALFVSGCARTVILAPTAPSATTRPASTASPLAAQADAAWKAGNMAAASSLYKRLADDASAPAVERTRACERLARISLSVGDDDAALAALDLWKQIAPNAASSPVWQDLRRRASAAEPEQGAYASVCAVLVLPITGDYAPFGEKIAAGAEAARAELGRAGVQIDLRLVDDESADWIEQLRGMPPQCAVVGGPLRHEKYARMKEAGIAADRAVFAFMPSLDASDEGFVAWRFFSSPEDQIQAVLRFASDLEISKYGLLSPNNAYGRRMGALFADAAAKAGASLKTTEYDPTAIETWDDVMRSFIGGYYMKDQIPVPSTTFQAAFIPDVWENLEILLPFLFYQGEDRLVIMGTSLWEQGLYNRTSVNVANLDLTVFPGAWNAASEEAAPLVEALAAQGRAAPEFWEAEGYDFVRFASMLNLKRPFSPADVNRRLAAQRMEWAMAPISWSGGRASQELFIFRPTSTGFEIVNPDEFRARLETIRTRHAKRVGKK